MSFFGADTEDLREAAKKCEETAKVTDDTIMFLKALVIILMAASVWTGGSSAAYAKYLQSTVIPWLQKISMALHLMAKVLGEHAHAQDEVSEGRNVDFSRLTQWQMPTLPTSSAREYPVMQFPTGVTAPAGAGSHTGAGTIGAPTASGRVPDLAIGGGFGGALGGGSTGGASGVDTGTFSGGAGGGLGAGSLGGGAGSGAVGSGGSGSGAGDFTGSAGSALGSGVPSTGAGAGAVGQYSGSPIGPDASGTGAAPIVGTNADGGSNAGTYTAAGAAGLLGLGGAAALAGAGNGLGQGKGFTSPTGFDYNRIKGVKDNPNVTPEFLRRTEQIATKLGCKPEDLLAVMSFESGESFSPSKKNPGSSATGLIQFMSATAKGLGTTTAELRGMTSVQQLDYVEKYFGNGKYSSLEELYSKVLAGHKISDPDKVLFTAGTQNYAANKNLDLKLGNGDGRITLAEATNAVRRKITAGN